MSGITRPLIEKSPHYGAYEVLCQDICSFGFTFSREDFCHLLAKEYFFVLSDCNYGEKQHHWRVSGMRMIFCANDAIC